MQIRTNKKGIELIKEGEGCKLSTYRDGGGVFTIGYGHTGRHAYEGNSITKEEAEQIFEEDLYNHEQDLLRLLKIELNEGQFSAVMSLVFNIGATQFATSSLLKYLNESNFDSAANEFYKWIWDNGHKIQGLINRRDRERRLFLQL